MATLVAGIFTNSQMAGETIGKLKEKGYTDHISVISKEMSGEVKNENIKETVGEATATGVITGGAMGALLGLIGGAVSLTVPGAILLIGGPLAASWGLTGAATGALTGGLLGAFVDLGIPEDQAKMFEDSLLRGETLVAVSGDESKEDEMTNALQVGGAREIITFPERG